MNQRKCLITPAGAECVVRCVTRYLTFHTINEAFPACASLC